LRTESNVLIYKTYKKKGVLLVLYYE